MHLRESNVCRRALFSHSLDELLLAHLEDLLDSLRFRNLFLIRIIVHYKGPSEPARSNPVLGMIAHGTVVEEALRLCNPIDIPSFDRL